MGWKIPVNTFTGQRILMRRPWASVCNVVLDVHVKRYDMCISYSTTCASRAALHVHVKQDCVPGKGTFLSEKAKVQHRTRGSMPFRGTSATEKTGPSSSLLYGFECISPQSNTEFHRVWIFIETQMIADFRKGKQMYDKEPQSFNLCLSVLIRVLSDK